MFFISNRGTEIFSLRQNKIDIITRTAKCVAAEAQKLHVYISHLRTLPSAINVDATAFSFFNKDALRDITLLGTLGTVGDGLKLLVSACVWVYVLWITTLTSPITPKC